NALGFENLTAIWPNYEKRGAKAMLLARVVEDPEDRERYKKAIPKSKLFVVHLSAPLETALSRLEHREKGDWLALLTETSTRLHPILESNGVADLNLDATETSPEDLAQLIFDSLESGLI